MKKILIAFIIGTILFTIFTNHTIPNAHADDLIIEEECTSDGWLATITDTEGNPLTAVRVGTMKKISSTSPEESFFTDEKGMVLIPFSSLTGFTVISKGGYNDQRLVITCASSSPDVYSDKIEEQIPNSLPEFSIDYSSELSENTKANYYFDQGFSALYFGEHKKAIPFFDSALTEDPNFVSALINKGIALSKLDRHQEAIQSYDKALEIDPNNAVVLNNKGFSLMNLGNFNEAISNYKRSIEIDPTYLTALYNAADALSLEWYCEDANYYYDRIIEIDPTDPHAFNYKAWGLSGLGQVEEAVSTLDNLLEIDPNYLTNFEPFPVLIDKNNWSESYWENILRKYPNVWNGVSNNTVEFLVAVMDKTEIDTVCINESLIGLDKITDSEIHDQEKLQEVAPDHELGSNIPSFGVKFQTYQVPSIGLKFKTPENWIEEYVNEDLIVTTFRAPDNQAMINFVFQYMPTNVSLDVIREFELGEIKQISKNFILEDSSLVSIGDDLGGRIIYTIDDFGSTLKLMQIFMVKNNAEYVFSYASPPATFDVHLETIQKIIDSIEIESVEPPIIEHSNPNDNFKVEYPENWYLIEGDSSSGYMTSFIFPLKNMEDTFPEEVNIVVTENAENQSLENIVDELTKFYPDFIRDFKMIESQSTSLNRIDAHKFVYTGKVVNPYVDPNRLPVFGSHPLVDLINIVASEEIDSKIMQIVFPYDDKIFFLTYRASPNDFDSFLPEAEKVIDSFELGGVQPIPDWIKNNAKWWAEGGIGDKDFVTGIQFLIKEGIMTIPETAQGTTSGVSQEIPSWIKNNADWWSQGLISDDDFVKGIQFLVEQGIIQV